MFHMPRRHSGPISACEGEVEGKRRVEMHMQMPCAHTEMSAFSKSCRGEAVAREECGRLAKRLGILEWSEDRDHIWNQTSAVIAKNLCIEL